MRPDRSELSSAESATTSAWLTDWRARSWRWWRVQIAAEASLWAAAVAMALLVMTRYPPIAVLGGVVVVLWRAMAGGRVRDVRAMLQAVESREGRLQNALLTWHEMEAGALAAPAPFRHRLERQAHAALEGVSRPSARGRREWGVALAALGLALVGFWMVPVMRARSVVHPVASPTATSVPAPSGRTDVSFVVTPPAYTGRPVVEIADDSLVEALVGSSVEARYSGLPAGAAVRLGDRRLTWTRMDAVDAAAFTVEASGLLTVHDAAGNALRTTAIRAVPDAAPLVRINEPGHDLRVADASRLVPLLITASDDIGLHSLRLLYTRVTGSGESFEFTDGEVPVVVQRTSAVSWQARATLSLSGLEMGPGDTLVYYAVSRDGRLDAAGVAESERYLIEIPRPSALAGGDFSLPEPEQRYALSQRMVIQLTERLLQRRTRMNPAEYTREAQGLAVQQRRVRAEFVFLMGGEVVDEVEEAAHSHEIEAGRLDNSGQQELVEAVRQMAQAEQRLTDANLSEALPYEYRALNAIQAAFGKARYFMRTLPTTVAIDLTRRGSGDLYLADPSSWRRAPLAPDDVERGRAALAQLASLTPASDAAEAGIVAEALVGVDGHTAEWLQAVQGLAAAFGQDEMVDRRNAIDAMGDALRARLVLAAPASVPIVLSRGGGEAALRRTGRLPR